MSSSRIRADLLRTGSIVLIEPPAEPIVSRVGLSTIANYPPLTQARLAAQIDDPNVKIVDLRIPGESSSLLDALRRERITDLSCRTWVSVR